MPQRKNKLNDDYFKGVSATNNRTQTSFAQRLIAAGESRGRLCVGIDPHPYLLKQWGLTDSIDGLRTFSRTCVEAFAGVAALVKPQVAFYERFGAAGFKVLEETLSSLREADCLSVADAKRGDIGSTMAGYADAWLSESSPLRADAVTVSPYLGVAALQPAFDVASTTGRGIFVLAATSNPEAARLQNFNDGTDTVAQHVVDICASFNREIVQDDGRAGPIGVVIGATVKNPPDLSGLNAPVLLPGVGSQGATEEDVLKITRAKPNLGFANVSRSILTVGPNVASMQAIVHETARKFWDES